MAYKSSTDLVPSRMNKYRPILTQYHQVPTSIAINWLSAIKYQMVPPYADSAPPSFNHRCPIIMTQYTASLPRTA